MYLLDKAFWLFGYVNFKVADNRINALCKLNSELNNLLDKKGANVKFCDSEASPEKVDYYELVLEKFEKEVHFLKSENGRLKSEIKRLKND